MYHINLIELTIQQHSSFAFLRFLFSNRLLRLFDQLFIFSLASCLFRRLGSFFILFIVYGQCLRIGFITESIHRKFQVFSVYCLPAIGDAFLTCSDLLRIKAYSLVRKLINSETHSWTISRASFAILASLGRAYFIILPILAIGKYLESK